MLATKKHYTMLAIKQVVLIFCVFALQLAMASRLVRSPDKMEVDIPNQSFERESGEYQENMQEEAHYWHEQGDNLEDKEGEGHQHLEDDRDKNQENYNHEKEHYQDQQHNYNKEMNQTYQEDRNKTTSQHQANQDHYDQHHANNYHSQPNITAEGLTDTETGDRYGEKGTEYKNEGEDKMQNYDVNGDSPSISYTRN